MKRKIFFWLLSLLTALSMLGCPAAKDPVYNPGDPGDPGDTRVTLAAGPHVSAAASDTGADVTFEGAAGLELAAGDFTASGTA